MPEQGKTTDVDTSIKRQAVVVVHGQGQQRPMGTIRDFVKVLWQFDASITPDDGAKKETWIVPDEKIGLYELQRITTPAHEKRRTDFYELYYADLLADTPIRNLWRWLVHLLWINPTEITARMLWPWRVFWVLTIIMGALAAFVVLSIPDLLHSDWRQPFFSFPRLVVSWVVAAIAGVALLVLYLPKLFSTGMTRARQVSRFVIGLILYVAVWLLYFDSAIPEAVTVGVVIYFAGNVLLPLFGDAASYLSAQTETVRSRQAIRERGLRLLLALHNDPEYDRIIVVAHSLGTVLAYDLLQLLWHSVGPTKDNPPSPAAVGALEAVRDYVNRADPKWTVDEVAHYQELQWQAFNQLRLQPAVEKTDDVPGLPAGWKISDFVSLGTPLASAQFLITAGKADFALMKTERVLPTAPPGPRDELQGFLYEEDGKWVTHHAAVFSTVRWTNIFDDFDPRWFIKGDVIGGPIAREEEGFGQAIKDVKVRITQGGRRTFSHNLYWVDPDFYGHDLPRNYAPPDHIAQLRAAVALRRK